MKYFCENDRLCNKKKKEIEICANVKSLLLTCSSSKQKCDKFFAVFGMKLLVKRAKHCLHPLFSEYHRSEVTGQKSLTQPTVSTRKLTLETLEQDVKYVQS